MLHHISVAVKNPQHVATVFAELFQGQSAPFPPNPNSYVALAADRFGTLIEFYPLGTEIIPELNAGQCGFQLQPHAPASYTSFHAALSIPVELETIERIGDREGWKVVHANRDGLFEVVELWVENRLMLELLTPKMAAHYQQLFSPENLPELAKAFGVETAMA